MRTEHTQDFILNAFYEVQKSMNEKDYETAEAALVILGGAMSSFSDSQHEEYWLAATRLETVLGNLGQLDNDY